ncbi:peptide chain release factor N(5)-glutamine methyltransferase [soil metagenome]
MAQPPERTGVDPPEPKRSAGSAGLTVREAITIGAMELAASPSTSSRLDCELILAHVLGVSRTQLLAHPEIELSPNDEGCFRSSIQRRQQGVPVAYLIGKRPFHRVELSVGPGALVPRPETEFLVEWTITWLKRRSAIASTTIVDAGTGSGAIALALANEMGADTSTIVGVDNSPEAMGWATTNRSALGLRSRVHLVLGNLLDWTSGPIDLVLANLPYLRPEQVDSNWELSAEPREALVGGSDGLASIRRLVADTGRVLSQEGAIALEIDPEQSADVSALFGKHLPDARTSVLSDLSGLDRFVVAERKLGFDHTGPVSDVT